MKFIIQKEAGNETLLDVLLSALPTLVKPLKLLNAVVEDRKEDNEKVFVSQTVIVSVNSMVLVKCKVRGLENVNKDLFVSPKLVEDLKSQDYHQAKKIKICDSYCKLQQC